MNSRYIESLEMKMPITAVIAGSNEGFLLRESLESADFCRERIYVDMESTDGSAEIATATGAKVLRHARVPVVEEIRAIASKSASFEWLLFLDPDERIMPELLADIRRNLNDDVGLIKVPCLFHFKGMPLRGTVWGSRLRPLLIHKDRAAIRSAVHGGYTVYPPFKTVEVMRVGNNYIQHLWARSYREIIRKHDRYAPLDGKSRFERGERASWKSFLYRPAAAFWESFVTRKGLHDGITGFLLSILYAYYIFACYYSLLTYQRHAAKSRSGL